MTTETELATKLHQNSAAFITFSHEIASDYCEKYKLNVKIYPYLKIGIQWTAPEKTIEQFLRVSMKAAAKDRKLYPTPFDLPVVDGRSRFPYWESVRTRNLDFFIENVMLLVPEIDMKKVSDWKTIIPDLEYFTNEIMAAEIGKLLKLFKEGPLAEKRKDGTSDLDVLWDYFDAFIEHAIRYIHHRRKRERDYLKGIDLPREMKLFKIKV